MLDPEKMARFTFAVTSITLCGLIQVVFTLYGKDSVIGDIFGTHFVLPQPECLRNTYYKLQLLPRWFDPVVVTIKFRTITSDAAKAEDMQTAEKTYYGLLKDGTESTFFIPCHLFNLDEIEHYGRVTVRSKKEIMLYVMLKNDSYSVYPVNSLTTFYTLLTIPSIIFNVHFVTVTPTDDCNVTITDDSGNLHHTYVHAEGTYTYKSTTSFTGMQVTSDKNIFVISGMYHTDDQWTVLVEHSPPTISWGRHYLLSLPLRDAKFQFEIAVAAFSIGPPETLLVEYGDHNASIKTDGEAIFLNETVEDHFVMSISSAEQGFLLMFLLRSNIWQAKFYEGVMHYRYRLHALVSPVPLEQYFGDPCVKSHINIIFRRTMVVFVGLMNDSVEALGPMRLGQSPTMSQYGVRMFSQPSEWLAFRLNETPGGNLFCLWFHEQTVMRRADAVFYMNGASYVTPLNFSCERVLQNITVPLDDYVDNDCDGFIDEELNNGIDDDGDGLTDEDTTRYTLSHCLLNKHKFFWEPAVYKLTRFQSQSLQFARRLPDGYNTMVLFSALAGVLMVSVFIFFVWVQDQVEQFGDPLAPPSIFF